MNAKYLKKYTKRFYKMTVWRKKRELDKKINKKLKNLYERWAAIEDAEVAVVYWIIFIFSFLSSFKLLLDFDSGNDAYDNQISFRDYDNDHLNK